MSATDTSSDATHDSDAPTPVPGPKRLQPHQISVAIGIVIAILGYKAFDKCTPGDLSKEILVNRNVAAAIVAASVILGVCLIIAAAMVG